MTDVAPVFYLHFDTFRARRMAPVEGSYRTTDALKRGADRTSAGPREANKKPPLARGFRFAKKGESIGLVTIASAAVATATAAATVAAAATTAAATAIAAATATAAATESTTPAPTAAAAVFARAGFVDSEGAAAVLLAVEGGDGRLSLVIRGHLDEPEALGPPGVAIVDDLRGNHGPVLSEQLLEFRAIHLVAEVPDVKLLTHYASPVNG
jgi:hypothetical protein